MSQDYSIPREAEGPRGDETLGALTASRYQRGGADGGGEEGTKTHPPPEQPVSKSQMAETARRNEARRRRQKMRWRRRRAPGEQGTRPNTLTAHLALQLKTARTRAVSTTRWRRRCWREVNPVRGLQQERTAMGPRPTVLSKHRTRGGTKNPVGRVSRRRTPTAERRRKGAPLNGCLRLT